MDTDVGGDLRAYARLAGALLVVSFVAGGLGEAYAPSRILAAGDAAATAEHVRSLSGVLRWGFVSYLVEALADTALSVLFYVLLKPAGRAAALLAAFIGLISTTLFAVSEMFYFVLPSLLARGRFLEAFSPAQLDALTLLSMRVYGLSAGVFMVFYGAAWLIRAALFLRSRAIPRPLAGLLVLSGLGFVANAASAIFAIPIPGIEVAMLPGPVALAAWLLIRGVDARRLAG